VRIDTQVHLGCGEKLCFHASMQRSEHSAWEYRRKNGHSKGEKDIPPTQRSRVGLSVCVSVKNEEFDTRKGHSTYSRR
jgi:hypothetical protein